MTAMAQPRRSSSSKVERAAERANIEPRRFALVFDPPAVVLEYRDKKRDSLRHRKMQIPANCLHDLHLAVEKLVRHNNIHLHPSVVSTDQVQRLVSKLIGERREGSSQQAHEKPSKQQAIGADPFAAAAAASQDPFADPFAKPELRKEDVLEDKVDLQKADEDDLRQAKALMEEEFQKAALRPVDENFVYDKQEHFELVEGPGEWDDDDDESECASPSPGVASLSAGSPP